METVVHNGITYFSLKNCKECDGYGEGYFVSRCGNVVSYKNGKIKPMKKVVNNKGYLKVQLCNNAKVKWKLIHRLVASMFLLDGKAIPEGLEVDHCNRIPTNNNLYNLRIIPHKENMENSLLDEEARKEIEFHSIEGYKIWLNSPVEIF